MYVDPNPRNDGHDHRSTHLSDFTDSRHGARRMHILTDPFQSQRDWGGLRLLSKGSPDRRREVRL